MLRRPVFLSFASRRVFLTTTTTVVGGLSSPLARYSSTDASQNNKDKKDSDAANEREEAEDTTNTTRASENEETNNNNNNDNENNEKKDEHAMTTRHRGFIKPSNDIVMETARKALEREGRDEIPEAIVWSEDTSAPPILAKGKKNIYDYTDDIPQHVKPFWHHEYYQQREYFRLQREKRPWSERVRLYGGLAVLAALLYGVVVLFRVWVEQPREIRGLREEILQHTYGKVLELAAGHGQNIGAYPFAVEEIVLSDSNPQQLQALRYRIPRTAYPKYEVRRVKSEQLDKVFSPGEFDCVVDMFGLCHMNDPVGALRQMQKVVKPTGLILLLEHGRSPYPVVNYFLDLFEKRHEINTHGCRWNSPIHDYIKDSRLEVKELRNMHYGTTYYVVAYPETLDAYGVRDNKENNNNNNNKENNNNKSGGGGWKSWIGLGNQKKKNEGNEAEVASAKA